MAGCTECGAAIKAGSRSCEYCGSRVDVGAFEAVLGFVEDRVKRRDEAARAVQEAKAERARIEEERRRKVLMASAVILVVCMLLLGVMAWNEDRADGHTAAMPDAASELKGENYEDVKTRLLAAGFTSIETASMDDLVFGWLKKDGEVERVSVDGETDFEVNSRYPKTAKIVITYHTFPKATSNNVAEGSPTTTTTEAPTTSTTEAPTTTTESSTTTIGTTTTTARAVVEVTVYSTTTGEKYHRESCSSLRKSKIPLTMDEAKAQGLEPCKICGPPA